MSASSTSAPFTSDSSMVCERKTIELTARYPVPALFRESKCISSVYPFEVTQQIAMAVLPKPESQKEPILRLYNWHPKLQEEISKRKLIMVIEFIEYNWNLLQMVHSRGGGIVNRYEQDEFPHLPRNLYVSSEGEVIINCKKRSINGKNRGKIVGKGGVKTVTMAVVYNPRSTALTRLLVLGITKLNSHITKELAKKEEYYGSLFKHENIIQLHSALYYKGSPKRPVIKQGLYMPFCNHPDLFQLIRDVMDERIRLKRLQIYTLFSTIVDGVKYLHDNGYIHFDLKPENILIHAQETHGGVVYVPKIADFASVKKAGDEIILENMGGTHAYLAPELVNCLKAHKKGAEEEKSYWLNQIAEKCDVYALGIIFGIVEYRVVPEWDDNKMVWNSFYQTLKEPRKNTMKHLIWKMTRNIPDERISITEVSDILHSRIGKLDATHRNRRERGVLCL